MNAIRPMRLAPVACLAAVVLLIGSPAGISAQPVVESEPENRQQLENIGLAYHLIDAVFNGRDPSVTATLVAEGAVIHTSSGEFTGPEGLLEYVANIRNVYPDAYFAITSISVTNDSAIIEWKLTAPRARENTSGRIDLLPVELTGVFTVEVGSGQVTHMSIISEDLIVAGPVNDDGPEVALDGPTLVGSGPEREIVAATGPGNEPGSPDGLSRIMLVHQLFDTVFNHGDADAARLVTADATIQTDYLSSVGPEGLVDYVTFLKRSYPDAVFDVTRIEVRGDTLEVRWTMAATHMIIDNREPSVEMDPSRTGVVTLTASESQVASLSLKTDFQRSAS